MKVRTSITLSRKAVRALDRLARWGGSRSQVTERAILEYAKQRERANRNSRERDLLDRHANALNGELRELLNFQAAMR